jgi:hypothetical protein
MWVVLLKKRERNHMTEENTVSTSPSGEQQITRRFTLHYPQSSWFDFALDFIVADNFENGYGSNWREASGRRQPEWPPCEVTHRVTEERINKFCEYFLGVPASLQKEVLYANIAGRETKEAYFYAVKGTVCHSNRTGFGGLFRFGFTGTEEQLDRLEKDLHTRTRPEGVYVLLGEEEFQQVKILRDPLKIGAFLISAYYPDYPEGDDLGSGVEVVS